LAPLPCPNGSRPRSNVPGTTPVTIRRADLRNIALPELETFGVTPRFLEDGETIDGFNINLTELLAPENVSVYGAIYGPETAFNFCASPPPTTFPGADPGTNALGAIAAENLWNRLCTCIPQQPPGCALYNGAGQCEGIEYRVTTTVTRARFGDPDDTYTQTFTSECYQLDINDPGDYGGLYGAVGNTFVLQTERQVRIRGFSRYGQIPRDLPVSSASTADPVVSYAVTSIVPCIEGTPDNCCNVPPDEPEPPPQEYPDPVFDSEDDGGGSEVTIVFVPCCPGPEGPPGEDGKDAAMFDVSPDLIWSQLGDEGAFIDDLGGPAYGCRIVTTYAAPGTGREPGTGDVDGRYDLGRFALGNSSWGKLPWQTIDSRSVTIVDKVSGPFTMLEVLPRPGVIVDVYVLRKVEEQ